MEFRDLLPGDVEAIRARSEKGYDKLPDPQDFDEAIVGLDSDGEPRIIMKAQRVAEIYMLMDHAWETPAMRWAIIEQAHQQMQKRLVAKGYRVAYAFFADGVPNGYVRRLIPLGWQRKIERCLRLAARGTA